MDLNAIVEKLRREEGDSVSIEAKSATGGLPDSITKTLCALANLPGGGIIILGLDESNRFGVVPLSDLQTLKQGLSGKARACIPPVQIDFLDQDVAKVDGKDVIVATVIEAEKASKPVRVSSGGRSYLRVWDGDYVMSDEEEEGFRGGRNHPNADQKPVVGASKDDLDSDLLALWEEAVKKNDPNGLGRFSDTELLIRAGILDGETKIPTLAGLLALGKQPQQFYPRFVLCLSKVPNSGTLDSRSTNLTTLSGPIPRMLDGALEWARKSFSTSVVTTSQGEVKDQDEFPLDAFRELISNALAHRDLAAWAQGEATEVRLHSDRLVIVNPGGLYGISVDRLGRAGTTSARNGRLIELLKHTRTSNGARVVESLASGIPRVLESAEKAGMLVPIFLDTGIRFTVVWHSSISVSAATDITFTVTAQATVSKLSVSPTFADKSMLIRTALSDDKKSLSELGTDLGLSREVLRYHLNKLIKAKAVESIGGSGKSTFYRLIR